MPRSIDMMMADLMRTTGGDMNTMRRVEQFGPDILKQYGAQSPEMLPAGNPMAQMPIDASVDPNYMPPPDADPTYMPPGMREEDLQLPPTVADPRGVPAYDPTKWQEEGPTVPQQSKYSGPAKGFSKLGKQGTASESPAQGFSNMPGRKGGPVTQSEMTALNTPTVPQAPSDNMLDAVIAEQLGTQSGVPAGQSALDQDTMMKMAAGGGAAAAGATAYGMGKSVQAGQRREATRQGEARLEGEYGPRPQADITSERLEGEYGPAKPMPQSSQGSPDGMKSDAIDRAINETMPPQNSQATTIKDPEMTPYQSKTPQGMAVEREFAMTNAAKEFGQALDAVPGYEGRGSTFANQLTQAIQAKDANTVQQMLSSLPDNMYQDFWNRVNRMHNNDPGAGLEQLLKHRSWLDADRFARSKGESITQGLRNAVRSFR